MPDRGMNFSMVVRPRELMALAGSLSFSNQIFTPSNAPRNTFQALTLGNLAAY
jgi:hypothetical protein